mmetsp:Transcript_18290/g.36985  ORF Transcript_18290/g.36985 Transcript_18290/m.36985 type:complete len:237 (+) Transcript_18290:95-805(+)
MGDTQTVRPTSKPTCKGTEKRIYVRRNAQPTNHLCCNQSNICTPPMFAASRPRELNSRKPLLVIRVQRLQHLGQRSINPVSDGSGHLISTHHSWRRLRRRLQRWPILLQLHPSTRGINQIDGDVWQPAIREQRREQYRRAKGCVAKVDAVVSGVHRSQSSQNLDRMIGARLRDVQGDKASLERGIRLDVLFILCGGRRADHLDVPACKGCLKHVRHIQRPALRCPSLHYGVYLVYK